MIFSTHFLSSRVLTQLRKEHNLKFSIITYLTDVFYFSNLWLNRDVDHFVVASEQAKQQILAKGIPEDRVSAFPYPVRKSFFDIERSKEEITRSMDLDHSKKTLLITLGGESVAPVERYLQALVDRGLELNVILVTGNNRKLQKKIETVFCRTKPHIICLGFVTNMNELIHISDFCFIKPGSATTWEVMGYRKPIIFYRSAQIGEDGNISFARKNGVGFYAGTSIRRFTRIVTNFVHGTALSECKKQYSLLSIENGADPLARLIRHIVNST